MLKIDRFLMVPLSLIGFFMLSALLNLGQSNALYPIRYVEYFVFGGAGMWFAAQGCSLSRLVKTLLAANCLVILAQAAGLVGGFDADGYVPKAPRPFGLCNHPAEMGAVLSILFAVLVFGFPVRFWRWWLLVGISVVLTGSRTALLAHFVLTLAYFYWRSRRRSAFIFKAVAITAITVGSFVLIPNPVMERSADVFSTANIEIAQSLYNAAPDASKFEGFNNHDGGAPDEAPDSVDASWYMRIFKWVQVVKIMATSGLKTWAVGLGPGSLGPALDGGWLRLVSECGLIGLFLFLLMLRKISALSPACAMACVGLSINMLMIDSYLSYKVMSMLFFVTGYYFVQKRAMLSYWVDIPARLPEPVQTEVEAT